MAPARKLVSLTSASGWIGRRVCQELQDRGIAVAAFDQVLTEGAWAQSSVGGLNRLYQLLAELRVLLEATVALVNCAGRAHKPMETPSEIQTLERTKINGVRDLLEACRATGVTRIGYVSTIA